MRGAEPVAAYYHLIGPARGFERHDGTSEHGIRPAERDRQSASRFPRSQIQPGRLTLVLDTCSFKLDLVKPSERLIHPSRKEFLALAREHTLVPVCRTLTADLETPVSAFLRAAWQERECFLLESVEGGEQVGRYTFIGVNPYKRIVARGRQIEITEGKRTARLEGDVFAVLRDALGGHKPARLPGLPPFTAGAVGVFAYDAVRQIERLPEHAKDELGVPDACLMFFDEVLAFDHVRKEIWLVVTADVTLESPDKAYAGALKRLARLEKRLAQPLPKVAARKGPGKLDVAHRTRKRDYMAGVQRCKDYIAAGDIVPGGAFAALRHGAGRGHVPGVPGAAHREPQPVYVLFAICGGGAVGRAVEAKKRKPGQRKKSVRAGGLVAGIAGARARAESGISSHCRARGRGARMSRRTRNSPTRCCMTRKNAPST